MLIALWICIFIWYSIGIVFYFLLCLEYSREITIEDLIISIFAGLLGLIVILLYLSYSGILEKPIYRSNRQNNRDLCI